MNKDEYIKKWSEKLSLTVEEINTEFDKIFNEEKLVHKDLSEEMQQQRAIQRLALMYKKQLRSPAVGFEGVIIGIGDSVDIVAKKRREAIELFKIDPQTAISEGVTNEEGVPLDNRPEWSTGRANNMFGKPLPESNFLRTIFGIAKKTKSDDTPRFFSMSLSGQKAQDDNMPFMKPINFMAIDKTQDGDNQYKLNASQFTNFTLNVNLQLPINKEVLQKYYGITELSNLGEYHKQKDVTDYNNIVITEGDVSKLNLEPTAFGSRIMAIEDPNASLEDLESKGATCWLPERINVDFGEGSKVLVIGKTSQGKKKDDQGNTTEELGDVTINVYGLLVDPKYKIELPEELKPITEESLDLDTDINKE